MSEIFLNDGGTPRSLGHTADPKLPGKVSELEKRVEVLEAKPGYVLPAASTETLGGVKVDGTTITAAEDGTISAVGDGSGPALSDAVDSDSSTTAASSLAVKTAYDAATAAQSAADAAQATATDAGETADAAKQAAATALETASAADAAADAAKAAAEAAQEKAEQALSGITVPTGGIIAFSGSFGGTGNRYPIPLGGTEPDTHWVLCDGGASGTGIGAVPDLRGRMILGASDAYPKGASGGAATHSHTLSGNVGATTLTVAQMPGHNHTLKIIQGSPDGGNWTIKNNLSTEYDMSMDYSAATGGSKSHTHALSGASGQASSLPPYYALAYIMRVA